jgi:hypothetical protein
MLVEEGFLFNGVLYLFESFFDVRDLLVGTFNVAEVFTIWTNVVFTFENIVVAIFKLVIEVLSRSVFSMCDDTVILVSEAVLTITDVVSMVNDVSVSLSVDGIRAEVLLVIDNMVVVVSLYYLIEILILQLMW